MTHPRDYVKRCAACGTPAGRHYDGSCLGFVPEPRSRMAAIPDALIGVGITVFCGYARVLDPVLSRIARTLSKENR